MRRIAVLNQKGGVGKTTTVANLSASLAKLGRRVLTVDLDPQANLTLHLGVDPVGLEHSVYNLMLGECGGFQAVKDTQVEGLDLIPATIDLAGFEVELAQAEGRQLLLKNALDPLAGDYDFIFIDCPPSLGLLTINALIAAREVFIALQTEFFALQGVSRLLHTCELIRDRMNPALKVSGVLACMYDHRTALGKAVLEDIRSYFGDKVFRTVIRKNIRLAEAPSFGVPISLYDSKSYGAADYLALAREILGMPPAAPPPLPGKAKAAPAPAGSPASATPPAPAEPEDEPPPLDVVAPAPAEKAGVAETPARPADGAEGGAVPAEPSSH